jgi:hypothetical protein
MRKVILLLIIFFPLSIFAQFKSSKPKIFKRSFASKKNQPRKEYILGIGGANFLGDVGGAPAIGTHFVKDFNFSATRPSFALGVRYKPNSRVGIKGGFYYQMVSGSDKLTTEPFRNNRNISFRTSIYELSVQTEFFLMKEQQGHRYNIKNAKGMKSFDIQNYIFVGVGGFYFNPKAKYNSTWVSLQPLGTEGQGLPGGAKKYSRISICIPYGIGTRYMIAKDWAVGLELGIRKTFTDYIDDVSTVYYDNKLLLEERGAIAAALADPSLLNYPEKLGGTKSSATQTSAGQQRGESKYKDAYMFVNATVSYKIPYRRRTRSKF